MSDPLSLHDHLSKRAGGLIAERLRVIKKAKSSL